MIKIFLATILWILLQTTGNVINRLPQHDLVGGLLTITDQILTQGAKGRSFSPNSSLCETGDTVYLGAYELKISEQPRGYCEFCCPLIKPAKHVRLYFSNKAKANNVELKMSKKAGALRSAGVDSNLPTVVFIHGFTEFGLASHSLYIRDSYLSLDQDYNVILVDWGELASFPWYTQAVQNTRVVGDLLGKFIKFYNATGELPISNLHLIGFSLGAHVAGFAGKHFQGRQKIPRITGLDTAFPHVPANDSSQRLSKDDAEYVDLIHTDGGKFGFPISLGHADFYPNGGTFIQPGCEISGLVQDNIIDQIGFCSHKRAWKFYAESVRNPKAFPATKCGIMHEAEGSLKRCGFMTDAYMGFPASKTTTMGDYYLTTNKQEPFGKSAKDQEADMKTINLVL